MQNRNILDILNLSPLQLGILFHHLYEREDPYVVQSEISLAGELEPDSLREGLSRLIEKHDALRSVVVHQKLARPRLVVHPAAQTAFAFHDLTPLEEAEREPFFDDYRAKDARQGFRLERGPLLRMALFKMGERAFRLLLTSHHIIMDGWCNGVFFGQLIRFAREARAGKPSDLRRDSSFCEHLKWLDRQDPKEGLAYWKNRLSGLSQASSIPFVKPSGCPAVPRSLSFRLDSAQSEGLRRLAQAWDVTPNALLQAAWAVVLGRYNDTRDVVFGTVVSGRREELAGVETSIGAYINTIPVRCQFEGASFEALARSVHEFFRESARFQHVSLPLVQKETGAQSGLFDHLFVYQNFPLELGLEGGAGEFAITDVKGYESTSYPLNIVVHDQGDLLFSFKYDEARIDREQVERLSSHLRSAIERVVSRPYVKAEQIDILTEEERRRVLLDFNQTRRNWPACGTVLDLFAAVVSRQPDQPAVVEGERRISYGELDRLAASICSRLLQRGCGAGDVVAICAENSIELVAAVLGVARSGAAFLPLDAKSPRARLEQVISIAGVRVLLTQQADLSLDPSLGVCAIPLDEATLRGPADVPPRRAGPSDIAYVIFTSGSTGVPKGVPVSHAALVNLCLWHLEAFALGPSSRSTKYASPGFDASVWEIFPTLVCGAALHVVPEPIRLDLGGLQRWFEEHGITHAFLPTPVCEQFQKAGCQSLEVLLTGGDTLRDSAFVGSYRLFNNYGPTENAVVSTSWEVVNGAKDISIGRPISNVQAYVLDSGLHPCPIGVPGELTLSGAGLAAGYLNDPELTRQRFIDSPFGSGTLYRSGDLASWNPDGTLRFLGRRDDQVKINGNRIECGEIEAVAARISGLACSKVQVVEHQGRRGLWLFYSQDRAARPPILEGEVLQYLKERLPAAMVPAHALRLDVMPLTVNGKIDAKQLQAAALQALTTRGSPGAAFFEPSHQERCVLEGFAQEVGVPVDRLRPQDDFFALGGDSIAAMRLAGHLQKHLNVDIQVADIFSNPVLGDLLKRVHLPSERGHAPPALEKAQRRDFYPLSPEQQRLYFLSRLTRDTSYNVTSLFELPSALATAALARALVQLVRRHAALRTIHRELDGAVVQSVLEDVPFGVEEIETASVEGQAIAHHVRPFDLSREIPIRAVVLRTAEARYLLLDVHHLAVDLRSMHILMSELRELCRGRALPPVAYDHLDYCVWRGRRSEEHAPSVEFWKRAMAGVPPLSFPSDFQRPPLKSFRGACVESSWSAVEKRAILAHCRSRGLTPFTFLAGALAVALERFSGDRDVVIGTPIDLRRYGQLDGVVGMLTGTLPIRLFPDPAKTASEYFRETREAVAACFRHSDLPFERIVALSEQKKDASRNPLFDVMLVVRDAPGGGVAGKAEMRQVRLPRSTSKFDLLIDLELGESGIQLDVEYCTDLYVEETLTSFVEVFRRVCLAAAEDDHSPLGELDVLGREEHGFLIHDLNRTDKAFGRDVLIQELLQARAARAGDTGAVVEGGRRRDLREWERRSNRLAHALRRQGIGRGDRVAVRMGRSFEMMVAIMGAMKAGAAYVPLALDYPDARTAELLRAGGVKALLVDRPLSPQVDFRGLCLDLRSRAFEDMPEQAPERVNESLDPAVVIHTSGSTGVPKGVVIPHQMLVNSLQSMQNDYPVEEGDVYLFKTSVVFDVSVTELFSLLMGRGSVALIPSGAERDPEEICRCIEEERVTHVNFVPSMLDAFLEYRGRQAERLSSLKYLFVAGEKLLPTTIAKIREAGIAAKIVNIYGPTETFYTTQCVVDPAEVLSSRRPIPIGRPFDNMQVYLLDSSHRPVPRGAIGELCVSGTGVAKGYLDKALEAGRFVENPFVPGTTMYKTGDLARLRGDFQIEYLGRRDRQVKIAGRRVECSEIECAILKHAEVAQAVVRPWPTDEKSQDLRLCAYVQMAQAGDVQVIRRRLADQLPPHMIPSCFIEVEEFPRTTSGKMDVNRLPAPSTVHWPRPAETSWTPVELEVRSLWAEVLGVDADRLGHQDDFFEMGGTSLSVIRTVALISRRFGVQVGVEDLFKNRTIVDVAALLDGGGGRERGTALTRLGSAPGRGIFCIPGINGHALGFKDLANASTAHALLCLEPIDLRARQLVPLDSFEALCQGYLQSLKQEQPNGPYLLLGHSSGGLVALQLANLLERQGDSVDGVVLLDAFARFEGRNLAWVLERRRMEPLGAPYIHHIFSGFERYLGQELGIAVEDLALMSEAQRLSHVARRLAVHQITPHEDPVFVRRYLELRKAHENLLTDYYQGRERPRFGGRVYLVKASEILPHQSRDSQEDYGWNEYLPHPVQQVAAPGNHESLITAPHAAALARLFTRLLDGRNAGSEAGLAARMAD